MTLTGTPTTNGQVVHDEAPDDASGAWLTVPEVTARTSKTERTIRRWIEQGQLKSKSANGRILVWMDAEPRTGAAPVVPPDLAPLDATRDLAAQVLALATAQPERLAALATEQAAPLLAAYEAARREHAAQLDARDARIEALATENGRLAAEARALVLANLALEKRRASWWRRLLG